MAIFVQTWVAKINYKDQLGLHEDSKTITLQIEAEDEYDAKCKSFFAMKDAYLTWGNPTEILKAKD